MTFFFFFFFKMEVEWKISFLKQLTFLRKTKHIYNMFSFPKTFHTTFRRRYLFIIKKKYFRLCLIELSPLWFYENKTCLDSLKSMSGKTKHIIFYHLQFWPKCSFVHIYLFREMNSLTWGQKLPITVQMICIFLASKCQHGHHLPQLPLDDLELQLCDAYKLST